MWNDFFTAEEWLLISLSLEIALWATVISLPFAVWNGYILARREFWGKAFLNGFVHMPLILPPVVTGYLLLISLGKNGFIGEFLYDNFGIIFAFHKSGAIIAGAVMGFPLMVRAIRLSVEALDGRVEEAATSLGGSPFMVFMTVSLPMMMPGILTGAILGFAKAMGEFGATITFAAAIPGETETLPAAIYGYLQVPGGEASAIKLVVISVIIAMLALTLSEALARRMYNKIGGRYA